MGERRGIQGKTKNDFAIRNQTTTLDFNDRTGETYLNANLIKYKDSIKQYRKQLAT